MEDWQKWTRRETKVKKPPTYLFFPNRTPAQTYIISVLTGCAIMGFSYVLLENSSRTQGKAVKAVERDQIAQSDMHNEQTAIFMRYYDNNRIRGQRRILNLSDKPVSAVLITDPEARNPEPKGIVE
ncbi:uncharacterized protein BEWA_022260 [Theileria equi strain WA]|uniref:Membrane protein, putative n=1 Tax=Theileria equi strain WA TaxID=1537102 RepID=L0AVX9_THEEQ|nr:uncharacterized protein BEWA_022260 [Theileria equi strain WA]AFZ79378.1 membrane protein, putative [Theileria equi strain WA]|eukprot:XP_004829044.1 uncharacterized protein BEWA_022260 [Theileria equi strain WA]